MTTAEAPPGKSYSGPTLAFAGGMALFVLSGFAGLTPIIWQGIRDYRTAKVYVESSAEILEYVPITSSYRNPSGNRRSRTRPSFVFRFATKEGQTITTRGYDSYGGREAPGGEFSQFQVGSTYPVWYDPGNPKRAVLSRRFNPHYYWLVCLPLGFILLPGLLLRECLRRAVPPTLKGIEPGRRLGWRLPPVTTQRAMTGCLGVGAILLALVTGGLSMTALDYPHDSAEYYWISRMLGFRMNGWWIVALVAALGTGVFVWAFLFNLRWFTVPEPEVEIEMTRLLPGQSAKLLVFQRGPIRADKYTISLVCEINGIPGKPPAIRKPLLERTSVEIGSSRSFDSLEFEVDVHMPKNARSTRKTVPMQKKGVTMPTSASDLVRWFIRVERQVSPKNTLLTDFEILAGPEGQ